MNDVGQHLGRRWHLEVAALSPLMLDPTSAPITVRARARSADPTRTRMIRQAFEAEVLRRFRELIDLIEQQVVELDGFGLEPSGLKAAAHVSPAAGPETLRAVHEMALAVHKSTVGAQLTVHRPRFDFPRSDQKVAAFMQWLKDAQRARILGVSEGVPLERAAASAWTSKYIESAYQRGIAETGAKLRAAGADVAPEWVSRAFNRPIHADRVGLIYTRVFSELRDVTEVMDEQISSVLARGLAEGRNPLEIARTLRDRVEKIGITRARTIARTEVIAAHAEATLNGFEEAGIAGVEVEAEWLTAGDDKVCPLCEELEGRVFSLDEARNMLPRHPNCRCAWRPKVIAASGVTLNWVARRPRHVHAA